MNDLQQMFIKYLEFEFEKVKNDPLKLQLFYVKNKENLKKLQSTDDMTLEKFKTFFQSTKSSVNTNSHVISKTINKHEEPNKITKINNINPNNTTPKISKLPVSELRGNALCNTKMIKFKMTGPTRWMYDYKLQRLTTNNISDFVITIASIPSEHIIIKDNKVMIKLYIFDRIWKEVIILFTPNGETEEGTIIRTRDITV